MNWCTLAMMTVVLLAASCTTQPILSPSRIDVHPLNEITLWHDPHSLDPAFTDYESIVSDGVHLESSARSATGLQEWRTWHEQKYDFLGVRVDVFLYDSIAAATRGFDESSPLMPGHDSRFTRRFGNDGNRCCVWPTMQARSDQFSEPMQSFHSSVSFQRRNVVIVVNEQSDKPDFPGTPGVIRELARRLATIAD